VYHSATFTIRISPDVDATKDTEEGACVVLSSVGF